MNIKTIGAALALGAVVAGCSKEEEPVEAPKAEQTAKADEAVLTVAGEKLMRSQVDADVEALIKAQGDRIPAEQLEYAKQMFRSQIVQGFIAQRALLAMAKAAGYVVTDADRAKRSEEVMKLLAKQPDAPKTIDEYFAKFPKNLEDSIIMIVDPMLATGGSAIAAIDMMKKRGAKNIRLVCLVGAPEGAKAVQETHPDVDIYLAAMDDHLNEIGYIVPGLGDAGDRIFGTK